MTVVKNQRRDISICQDEEYPWHAPPTSAGRILFWTRKPTGIYILRFFPTRIPQSSTIPRAQHGSREDKDDTRPGEVS